LEEEQAVETKGNLEGEVEENREGEAGPERDGTAGRVRRRSLRDEASAAEAAGTGQRSPRGGEEMWALGKAARGE